MFFRRNRDRIAFTERQVEDLISALRSRSPETAFANATAVLNGAVNGPPVSGIRFRDVLYWKLSSGVRNQLGELAKQLDTELKSLENEGDTSSPDAGPMTPGAESLGINWIMIFDLVSMVISILKEIFENRATVGNDGEDSEEDAGS